MNFNTTQPRPPILISKSLSLGLPEQFRGGLVLLHLLLIPLWAILIRNLICASYIFARQIRDLISCLYIIDIRISMKVERMGILGLCVSALILILLVLSSICGAESRRMLTDSNGRRYLEKNSDDPGNQALNIPAPRPLVYESDDGNEIDPRYGVEKRLVPTGPNPLHH